MKDVAVHDRPREKLARAGAETLGDNELVAVLLGSGTRTRGALAIAEDMLKRVGGVKGLCRVGIQDLRRIAGIGMPRAARLLAAVELGRRVVAAQAGPRPMLATPSSAAEYLLPLYGGYPVERFGVLLLDGRHQVIRSTILSVGSLDVSIAHPREIFREAVAGLATSIIVFHNHPTGDPKPSPEDVVLTGRLIDAGGVVGIDVVDHIILGDGCWYSFREARRL